MKKLYAKKEKLDRLNITLPNYMHSILISLIEEVKIKKTEAIRQAVKMWIEKQINERMLKGYKAMANEDLEMLEEFKYVDNEGW
jgi:hypothetical protein